MKSDTTINTISAKELRDNLSDIAKRVENGERILVSYRNKPSFELQPITEATAPKEPLSGLRNFLSLPKKNIANKYKTGDLKQLYYKEIKANHDKT